MNDNITDPETLKQHLAIVQDEIDGISHELFMRDTYELNDRTYFSKARLKKVNKMLAEKTKELNIIKTKLLIF